MKKMLIGWVLLLVGALLVTTAMLMWFVLPGKAQRVPFNTDQTTRLSGQAVKYNAATGKDDAFPVKVTNISQVNGAASNDDTVVWKSTVCVNKDLDNAPDCIEAPAEGDAAAAEDTLLVENQLSVFATDRHTALAVGDYKGIPSELKEFSNPNIEGLVNKFPFDTQKKDYPYWDDTLGRPLTAKFEGVEKIEGLEVYKFVVQADKEPAVISMLGDAEVHGTYSPKITIYIEPVTGAPVNQIQEQKRWMDDGTQVIDLKVEFTDAQKKTSIEDAKKNVKMLNLFSGFLPVALFVVGLLLLAGGVFLQLRAKNAPSGKAHASA